MGDDMDKVIMWLGIALFFSIVSLIAKVLLMIMNYREKKGGKR